MKIRTFTIGTNLENPINSENIKKNVSKALNGKKYLESKGYEVQTARIAFQPWEDVFKSDENFIQDLEEILNASGISYYSLGTVSNPKNIDFIYNLLSKSDKAFCTVSAVKNGEIDFESIKKSAELIKKMSAVSPDGFKNLQFAVLFNMESGSPFFPAAYHKGETSFAIGTENSDLIYKAFSQIKDLKTAKEELKKYLYPIYKKLEDTALEIEKNESIPFRGLDVSVATSIAEDESIAFAYEKLGLGRFGESGTLFISKIVTDALKELEVFKCGYSGLMLPVLEDFGLAQRNSEGYFNVSNLLLYSAVCGTGLDTIPLPGDIDVKRIEGMLLDTAALSVKLQKPLSARLMPVPGKEAGDLTEYDFPYFKNSKIMF